MSPAPGVEHDATQQRFSLTVDGKQAYLQYSIVDGVMALTHTDVPPAIGGRGIAAQLVKASLDHARAHGLKVQPDCSYAALYLRKHTEYADLRADPA